MTTPPAPPPPRHHPRYEDLLEEAKEKREEKYGKPEPEETEGDVELATNPISEQSVAELKAEIAALKGDVRSHGHTALTSHRPHADPTLTPHRPHCDPTVTHADPMPTTTPKLNWRPPRVMPASWPCSREQSD